MNKNTENDDVSINFNKLLRIIWSRRYWSLACYAVILVLTVIFTLTADKKYETDAQIHINKAQDTNLADINPFAISEAGGLSMTSGGGGLSGLASMLSGTASVQEEIEIMKSPLVMDKVIRDNDMKYTSGQKKGQYKNAVSFAKSDDLTIETELGTKTIKIAYKANDSKEAYNVVKSIVDNYKEVYEEMNSKKATRDKEFLEKSYDEALVDLDKKIDKLKDFVSDNIILSNAGSSGNMGFVSLYNKKVGEITQGSIEGAKVQAELEQEIEKVKLIKTRLEWIRLVENLSKDVSNLTVLKEPEIKESYEYSEPRMKINLIIGFLIAIAVSSLLALGLEVFDPRLTYYYMDDKTLLLSPSKYDISELKIRLMTEDIKNIGLLSLVDDIETNEFIDKLSQITSKKKININTTHESISVDEYINNLASSEFIILLAKPGYSNRKIFVKIKELCEKLNKEVLNSFFIVDKTKLF